VGDDGFVLRFPDTDEPPDPDWFLWNRQRLCSWCCGSWARPRCLPGASARLPDGRSCLPRRRADARSPLWAVAASVRTDLLSVASRYPAFPLLLEAYRECLRDVF